MTVMDILKFGDTNERSDQRKIVQITTNRFGRRLPPPPPVSLGLLNNLANKFHFKEKLVRSKEIQF